MNTAIATRTHFGQLISIIDPDIPCFRVLLTHAEAGQLLRELAILITDLDTQQDTHRRPQTTPTQPTPPQVPT